LLLEFNSHLGTNGIKNAELQKWLDAHAADVYLSYTPHLFSNPLELSAETAASLFGIASFQIVEKLGMEIKTLVKGFCS
jgi:hypothetical protein